MASNTDQNDENWARYLTLKLRRHFKRTGRYLVEQQLLGTGFTYPSKEKRLAAMVWLGEQRKMDRRIEIAILAGAMFVAILAAFGGAMLGAWMTSEGAAELRQQQTVQERQALTEALLADVISLKDVENQRFENLQPLIERLIEKEYTDDEARPWLMAPVPMRFPIFEGNAGQLGLLKSPLPEKIARFYGLSYMLRSHINTVTSPPMIKAGRGDRKFAVGAYEKTLDRWNSLADEIIAALSNCCE